jgi:hypothetical protein
MELNATLNTQLSTLNVEVQRRCGGLEGFVICFESRVLSVERCIVFVLRSAFYQPLPLRLFLAVSSRVHAIEPRAYC